MTDEEVAVIEAALAMDRLFWPPTATDAVPIGEVNQVVQNLRTAPVLRLEQKRSAEAAQ